MGLDLKGMITLNNTGFLNSINQCKQKASSLGDSMVSVGKKAGGLALATAGIAGISMGIKDTINTFVSFEKEMSNVKAITRETSEVQMKKLTEKAKEMGRILPASATDASIAMANLGKMGFTTDEILKSVEGTLFLATSAQIDMAQASEITAGTLRGFGLEADKANHVADVLSLTAVSSGAGITDLGEAMKYSAPIAHAMGLSLEEISASIGIMSDASIKGSQAGTTLRGALIRMTKTDVKSVKEAMEELGFSAYDANNKMKPLSKIVTELKQKTKGMTDKKRNEQLAKLFGTEALSGMLALIDAGPEKLSKLTRELEKSDGASKKMSETMTNNLYGAFQDLDGQLETMKINIGEKIAPALTGVVRKLADAVPGVGEAITSGMDSLGNFFERIGYQLEPAIKAFQDDFLPVIQDVGDIVVNDILPMLAKAFEDVMPAIADNFVQMCRDISTAWTGTLKPALEGAFPLLSKFAELAGGAIELASDTTSAVVKMGSGIAEGDVDKATEGLGDIFLGIGKQVDKATGAYKKPTSNVNTIMNPPKEKIEPKFYRDSFKYGKNANGTSYFGGGASLVNERGGEMQVLKNGTAVIPADRTKEMLERDSQKGGNQIYVNIDARGMDVDEMVDTLKIRLANL